MRSYAELVVHNIGVLATCAGGVKRGRDMLDAGLVEGAAVAVSGGRILAAGPEEEVKGAVRTDGRTKFIDAEGCLVTPGLVDCHTHLLHAGSREKELTWKLEGKSYLEILAAGGGILSTVRETRRAGDEMLLEQTKKRLARALAHGTTTVEIKSGYGLSVEEELRALRLVRRLQREQPVELVPTFLGAHAVPEEYKNEPDRYVDLVCDEMIPRVAREKLALFNDVFCEEGVFTVDQSRRILQAGLAHGLRPKIHADEMAGSGGAELAAEVGAVSADHLLHVSPRGIRALAAAGTVAVLLPGTAYYLASGHYAPARALIEAGVPVAVASDANPGSCPTEALQSLFNTACLYLRLRPAEVLNAMTVNGAAALGLAGWLGSIEPGKQADLVIWDAPNLDYPAYHFGVNLVRQVIKAGQIIGRGEECVC
ncbi:imidazolonepropionase [Desulfofundulus thermosubterraneus]|uniref:Imidazolonepropionase n=1 Tax=Desulfofundulus thermosubterraneus DSM 16057 TaxID=1121432 RepID=A0A1M6H974_9FIRM|nr:imidazolonepropionase [Desulfofundulus thermosubterraneus]SHJ18659.1 imidazolonepropionase [Desulfofundulus thermosubterraneus DSM 16057]